MLVLERCLFGLHGSGRSNQDAPYILYSAHLVVRVCHYYYGSVQCITDLSWSSQPFTAMDGRYNTPL